MKRQNDKQEIAQLLSKFMAGETSVAEEQMLALYFRTHAVGEEWTEYKEMFALFDSGEVDIELEDDTSEQLNNGDGGKIRMLPKAVEEKPKIVVLRWLTAAAACALLLIGFFTMKKNSEPVTDAPKIAQVSDSVEVKPSVVTSTVTYEKTLAQTPQKKQRHRKKRSNQVKPQEEDNRIRDLWRRSRESYDLIRSTCRQLAEEGTESYIWQSHRGGIDSVLYSIALRDYSSPQDDTFTPDLTTNPELTKYGVAKEGLILKVNPPLPAKKDRFLPKSVADVTYRLTFEEQDEDSIYYVDYKELAGVVDKVMKSNSVKSHPILITHDKGAKVENFMPGISRSDITHPDLDGETRGTVYEIETADKAKAVRDILSAGIGNYIDKHPKINYQYRPMQGYDGDLRGMFSSNNWLIRTEFHTRHLYKLDKYLSCRVLLLQDNQKAYVLVLESVNDFWLPKDWHKLKSWKNGEKEYLAE